jgi:hypothetical protein
METGFDKGSYEANKKGGYAFLLIYSKKKNPDFDGSGMFENGSLDLTS